MVLLLLIDAFRADYLPYTPFLRYLAASGASGRYEEPFGFAGHPSIFGGLTPGQAGYSNLFWHDPASSPFQAARYYPDPQGLSPHSASAVRQLVRRTAVSQTTPYGAAYLDPLEIPFHLLPCFDIPQKYPPWHARCGYRSIFHDLDRAGRKWLYAGWPVLNELGLRNDRQIVSWALANATAEHDLLFVQLCELDFYGHYHGPDSAELLTCLNETDRLVRFLVEGLARLGGEQHLIIFGDHGMVPVVRYLDLAAKLNQLEARAPEDFVYFLDSTCARFWYQSDCARHQVRNLLEGIPGGWFLSEADIQRWGLQGADSRNGEDFWLASPGVLISPNFFHSSQSPPCGMHGYAPDEPDNQGVFLATGPSISAGCDVGVVPSNSLHSWLVSLVFPGAAGSVELTTNTHPATGADDEPAARHVANDLSIICNEIERKGGDYHAIVHCGAFARGEGSLIAENGRVRILNDYDVAIIGGEIASRVDWKHESSLLAAQLNLPYLDIGWFAFEDFSKPALTIFNFDFRRSGRVLRGDATILDRMPVFPAADIPNTEVLRLLLNRVSGLLIGLKADLLQRVPEACVNSELLWIQVIKLGIAIADHHLFQWGAYDTSYRERRRRFKTLGESAGLPLTFLTGIDLCFELKLRPDARIYTDPIPLLRQQNPWWKKAVLARLLKAGASGDFREAAKTYIQTRPNTEIGVQERIRGCSALLWDSLTELLEPDQERMSQLSDVMAGAGISLPPPANCALQRYEALRGALVNAWEMACH